MKNKVKNYLKENWKDVVRTATYYSIGVVVGYKLHSYFMAEGFRVMHDTGKTITSTFSDGEYVLSLTKV